MLINLSFYCLNLLECIQWLSLRCILVIHNGHMKSMVTVASKIKSCLYFSSSGKVLLIPRIFMIHSTSLKLLVLTSNGKFAHMMTATEQCKKM